MKPLVHLDLRDQIMQFPCLFRQKHIAIEKSALSCVSPTFQSPKCGTLPSWGEYFLIPFFGSKYITILSIESFHIYIFSYHNTYSNMVNSSY